MTGDRLDLDDRLIAVGAPAVGFVVRLLALRYHWRAPRPRSVGR